MPRDEASDESLLSPADRQGIAEIRRQLDAEFEALVERPEGRRLQSIKAEHRARSRVRRRRVRAGLGVVVAGGLVGFSAGALFTRVVLDSDRGAQPAASIAPPRAETPPGPDASQRAQAEASPAEAVRRALDGWLDATVRRDIAAQMAFYPDVVPVYYTWRNVPAARVRDEKEKVFGEATILDIRAGPPTIEVASDGRSAVSRFRKAYVIEGPGVKRRGEVVQELRWSRTERGWRIISERDEAPATRGATRARP